MGGVGAWCIDQLPVPLRVSTEQARSCDLFEQCGVISGYFGIMGNKMETTIMGYIGIIGII